MRFGLVFSGEVHSLALRSCIQRRGSLARDSGLYSAITQLLAEPAKDATARLPHRGGGHPQFLGNRIRSLTLDHGSPERAPCSTGDRPFDLDHRAADEPVQIERAGRLRVLLAQCGDLAHSACVAAATGRQSSFSGAKPVDDPVPRDCPQPRAKGSLAAGFVMKARQSARDGNEYVLHYVSRILNAKPAPPTPCRDQRRVQVNELRPRWTGASAELTTVGQLLGTLDYMAPEQADRPDAVDHRSDLYSMGATLFRLLTGRAQFATGVNQSPLEKLRLLATETPPHVATLRDALPPALAALVDRLLERDPDRRPSSSAHLAEALAPFCAGADLKGLLEESRKVRDALAGNENDSLAEPLRLSPPSRFDAPHKPVKGKNKRWRTGRWLIALAAMLALAAAGIVLVLETQKGQIVIETEATGIEVELVADGVVRREIELVPGPNSTRIYAGEYLIRIHEGSDVLAVENNQSFVVKRGETVVARIRVHEGAGKAEIDWSTENGARAAPEHSASSHDTGARDAAGSALTEPVYEGKRLEDWLNLLEFEASSEYQNTALNALRKFTGQNPALGDKVSDWLMERVREDQAPYVLQRVPLSVQITDAALGELVAMSRTSNNARARVVLNMLTHNLIRRRNADSFDLLLDALKQGLNAGAFSDIDERTNYFENLFRQIIRMFPPGGGGLGGGAIGGQGSSLLREGFKRPFVEFLEFILTQSDVDPLQVASALEGEPAIRPFMVDLILSSLESGKLAVDDLAKATTWIAYNLPDNPGDDQLKRVSDWTDKSLSDIAEANNWTADSWRETRRIEFRADEGDGDVSLKFEVDPVNGTWRLLEGIYRARLTHGAVIGRDGLQKLVDATESAPQRLIAAVRSRPIEFEGYVLESVNVPKGLTPSGTVKVRATWRYTGNDPRNNTRQLGVEVPIEPELIVEVAVHTFASQLLGKFPGEDPSNRP